MEKKENYTIIETEKFSGDSKYFANALVRIMISIIMKNGGKLSLTQQDIQLSQNMAFEMKQDKNTLDIEFIAHPHPENKKCQ